MRFLLLCPIALVLLFDLPINIPTASAAGTEEPENRSVRELWDDVKALEEQNNVLQAKLEATQAEASKLRKSKLVNNCPTRLPV